MLQNKRLETKMLSLKNEISQGLEQRDAMKDYIRGLENALSTLQKKFDSSSSFVGGESIQEKIVLDQAPETAVPGSSSSSISKPLDEIMVEEKGESDNVSTKVDFKIKFMQKAFKSLLKARDSVSIRRHSEVMCSLLSYSPHERKEVLKHMEKLGPLLSALGM